MAKFNPARPCEQCGLPFFPAPHWRRRFCNDCRLRRDAAAFKRNNQRLKNKRRDRTNAERAADRYQKWRDAGLCGRCGKVPTDARSYCGRCAAKIQRPEAPVEVLGADNIRRRADAATAAIRERLNQRVKVFTAEEREELARRMGAGVSK